MKPLQMLSPSGSGRGPLFSSGTPLAVPVRLLTSETLANIFLQKRAGRNLTPPWCACTSQTPTYASTSSSSHQPWGSPGRVLQLSKELLFLCGLHQCLLGAHWVPGTMSRFCDPVIKGTSKNQVQWKYGEVPTTWMSGTCLYSHLSLGISKQYAMLHMQLCRVQGSYRV